MQKAFIAMLLAVSMCSAPVPSRTSASESAQAVDPTTSPEIQRIIDSRVANTPGTGIVIGLIKNGSISIYKAGSSGTDRPLDEHTVFGLGSATKIFTSLLLAQMALDGSVHITDPVSTYVPHGVLASPAGLRMTLLNLALQDSGLPWRPNNLHPETEHDPYAGYTIDELYTFLRSPLLPVTAPGDRISPSVIGAGLLGHILAARAHSTYEALLTARVLTPLAMHESSTSLTSDMPAHLAVAHDVDGFPLSARIYPEPVVAADGMHTTLSDMMKLLRCIMGSGPLADVCRSVQQPRRAYPGYKGLYEGLSWLIDTHGQFIESRSNSDAGYQITAMVTQDRKAGVVVLSNGPDDFDIARYALDPSYPVAIPASAVKLASETLNDYAGKYTNNSGSRSYSYMIFREGDRLAGQFAGQPVHYLYSDRNDHLYYRTPLDAYFIQHKGALDAILFTRPSLSLPPSDTPPDSTLEFVRRDGGIVGVLVHQRNGQPPIPFFRMGPDGKPLASDLVPAFPRAVSLDQATIQTYAGTYGKGDTLCTVWVTDGHVMLRIVGDHEAEIYPSAKDEFFFKVIDAQWTFNRDALGNVISLTLHQSGLDYTAPKRS